MRFNASTTLQKTTQNGESLYTLVLVKKNDISELIEDSDAENTFGERCMECSIQLNYRLVE